MLVIVGTVRLPPEKLGEARPAMASMITASRAEPGCIEYSYAQDVLDAGLIHVTEVWRDRAALDEHFRSAHIALWRKLGSAGDRRAQSRCLRGRRSQADLIAGLPQIIGHPVEPAVATATSQRLTVRSSSPERSCASSLSRA